MIHQYHYFFTLINVLLRSLERFRSYYLYIITTALKSQVTKTGWRAKLFTTPCYFYAICGANLY